MSVEIFAPPDREPDFHRVMPSGFPNYPEGEGWTQDLWTPTPDAPGQERITDICGPNTRPYVTRTRFVEIDRLAEAGMRQVFERFGLRSFYQETKDNETYGVPAIVRYAGLEFPSSAQLQARLADFSSDSGHRDDTFGITHISGKFDGITQISELAEGNIVMSVEDESDSIDGTYHLHYFSHDLRLHFPAWLCMPPTITVPLVREAEAATRARAAAAEDSRWRPLDLAERRMARMTELIDGLFTTRALLSLLDGGEPDYGKDMSELLGWPSHRFYENEIKKHIANPMMSDVLVSGWK